MLSYRDMLVRFLIGISFLCFSHASFANGVEGRIDSARKVTGVITGSGVDKYTLKATKGVAFVVTVSETGDHDAGFMPALKIFKPDKKPLHWRSQKFFFRIPVTSPAEGEWTLEVSRGDNGETGGNYELTLIEAPGTSGMPMKFKQVYPGTITRGSVDVYTMKGARDSDGELVLTSRGDPDFMPEVLAVLPDGNMMGGMSCPESCDMMLPLMPSGVHTIMVWRQDATDAKGSYTLTTRRGGTGMMSGQMGGMPDEIAGTLENGNPVTGVNRRGEVKSYKFKVAKRGGFMVSLSQKGKRVPGLAGSLQLYDPDNNPADAGGMDLFVRHLIPEVMREGEWRADVSGMDAGGEDWEFELEFVQVPGAKGKRMKFGETYTGTIVRGGIDVYTFSGTPGVLARMSLTAKGSKGFAPEYAVFAPSGKMIDATGCVEHCYSDLKMEEFGDYNVLVTRMDRNDIKDAYEFSVKRSDGEHEKAETTVSAIFRNPVVPVWEKRRLVMKRPVSLYKWGKFDDFNPYGLAVDQREMLATGATERKSQDEKRAASAWYRQTLGQEPSGPDMKLAGGYLSQRKFAEAKKLYLNAAEQGMVGAQFNLGVLYTLALDTPPDLAAAAKWYGKAAAQGHLIALNNLGELYEHGEGVKKDEAKAAKLYWKAAEAGYPQALYSLGRLAEEGRGIPKDPAKAAAWLRKAAGEGHVDAQGALDALEGRRAEAIKLWRRTAAHGNIVSLRRLTEMYRKEGIPPQDYDDVLALYRIVANEINPIAFAGLADLFAKQSPPDYFEAYFWYSLVLDSAKDVFLSRDEKAELVKYATAEAAKMAKKLLPEQIAVTKWRIDDRHPQQPSKKLEEAAKIHLRGWEISEAGDPTSAQLFYLRAAHMGLAPALNFLGHYYEYGLGGMSQDFGKAVEFYKKAAMAGRVSAATSIGKLYQFGIGVPYDLEEAAKWYAMDASRGYKAAIDRLGWIYLFGLKDGGKRAVAMYEKAAARDVDEANNALGMIYLYGMGGIKSEPRKALKWYLWLSRERNNRNGPQGDDVGVVQAAAILKNYEPHDYGRALKLVSSYISPVSLNNRAYMYEHGLGVKEEKLAEGRSRPTAIDLYKKAADMCYGRAMFNMGRLIASGVDAPEISSKPIKKNLVLARKWMEKAAYYGPPAAAIWLASSDPEVVKPVGTAPKEEVSIPPEPCPEAKGKQQ